VYKGVFPLVRLAAGTGTGTGKRKMKNKYLIFNQETVTCAKIALRFDWLLINNKSAEVANIV